MGRETPLALFAEPAPSTLRAGRVEATLSDASSILTPASGFMGGWDYTLNPYSGCGYGCNYCYAAFFVRDESLQDSWGEWVTVKQNAVDLLGRAVRRLAKKGDSLTGKTIYMSTVTDPYQPIERRLGLTRDLLSELVPHQPLLTVQTRGPLAARDIDLLKELGGAQVNMTVTTDSEEVRRAFEPHCSSNRKRLEAIAEIAAAGIDAGVTMTPLLPVENPAAFAAQIMSTGARRFVVQEFHAGSGRFVKGTRAAAERISEKMGWTGARYRETAAALKEALPHLTEGRAGFVPPVRST